VNVSSIIRRLEKALSESIGIRSEYWITDSGQLLNADDSGDYNHQAHVIDVICGIFRTAAGLPPQDNDDAVTCRTEIGDYLSDEYPDSDDPFTEYVEPQLVAKYGDPMTQDMRNQMSGHGDEDGYDFDARAFAVKWWGWIRVAGNEAEMRDFTPAMLKRAGVGFGQILEEEGEDDYDAFDAVPVTVSIYGKPGRVATTIGSLEAGKLERSDAPDPDQEALRAAGRAAADKLDRDSMPSFYKGRTGG